MIAKKTWPRNTGTLNRSCRATRFLPAHARHGFGDSMAALLSKWSSHLAPSARFSPQFMTKIWRGRSWIKDNRIIMDSHGMFGFQVFLFFLDNRHICNILQQTYLHYIVAICCNYIIHFNYFSWNGQQWGNQPASCRSRWITFPLGHSWRFILPGYDPFWEPLSTNQVFFGTDMVWNTTTSGSHRDLQLRRVTVFELQSLGLLWSHLLCVLARKPFRVDDLRVFNEPQNQDIHNII